MNVKKLVCSIISLSLLVNCGIAALPVSASAVDTDTEIYISPDGNDSNSGSSESPFKTLERAKAEVRVHNSNMSGNIIVNIASGVYYMDNTLEFTQADSGTNGFSVIYRGITDENGNSPIVSGGVDISDNWELYDESLNIYKHENIDWSFRQLYTNNDRAIRARVPNLENKETGGPYFRASGGDGSYPLFIGTNNEYAQKAGNDAEIIWNSSWSQFRARIESYNSSTGRVTFKAPDNSFAWNHHTQGDTPFYLENSLAYLDSEGEWYLDKDTSTLYYKPREGEIMNKTEIIAPKLETIIDINGTDENKTENITFDGIQFLHSNWLAPDSYG